jgi:hypothetical protein
VRIDTPCSVHCVVLLKRFHSVGTVEPANRGYDLRENILHRETDGDYMDSNVFSCALVELSNFRIRILEAPVAVH